jgi:hypothetical protein
MNRGVRLYLSFFGLMVLCLLMSCSTAHMALPTELLDSSEMLVCNGRGGFDETFTMGSYQVQNVKRGWTKKNEWVLSAIQVQLQTAVEFSLIHRQATMAGTGGTNLKQKELEVRHWWSMEDRSSEQRISSFDERSIDLDPVLVLKAKKSA